MSILLDQLVKRYEGHPVVNNVSLEIKDGEFFVLLGSSGSGKTTVLSAIAGLTELDSGRVLLHERDVTHLPTQQRNVGMVFQNYALFQHMTIAENIKFGLSVRKVSRSEQQARCDELLDLVGLAGLGNRMPRQLSGGQQQRVALARALIFKPAVLLLDEPLGALDAKIRVELRRTLKEIQRSLGVTTILVTHDQEEAFDLADRLGVMSFGRLLEVGTPEELYRYPRTEFVATFLGVANLMVGPATPTGVRLGSLQLELPELISAQKTRPVSDRRVQVLFRPEDIELAPCVEELPGSQLSEAEVEEVSFAGSVERLRLRLPPIRGVRPISPSVPFGSQEILLDAARLPDQASRYPLKPGDKAWVGISRAHALDHPGFQFLIVTDGSERAQAAIAVGAQIARMVQARVTLLGCCEREDTLSQHMQDARKQIGSGLSSLNVQQTSEPIVTAVRRAVEQHHFDLLVMGYRPQEDRLIAEQVMEEGEHHLLLVPSELGTPSRALICVAAGEPGKDDVFFAGRLLGHLGAEATIMTVVPSASQILAKRAKRYLELGIHTLETLNVLAESLAVSGPVKEAIAAELAGGEYDLLVLGSPLLDPNGKMSFSGMFADLLASTNGKPVLIVRSHFVGAKIYPLWK